jgi:hypothetical protein
MQSETIPQSRALGVLDRFLNFEIAMAESTCELSDAWQAKVRAKLRLEATPPNSVDAAARAILYELFDSPLLPDSGDVREAV